MDTHDDRAGPGAQKGDRGGFAGEASTPDQPPRRDTIFFYANASGTSSPTFSAPVSADIPGAGHDGASGGMPEVPPGGTDTGRYEADGAPSSVSAQPPAPSSEHDDHLGEGEVPLGSVVYDSGWEDCSGTAVRVVFTAGPANQYLRDWVRELALHPRPPTGGGAGDDE